MRIADSLRVWARQLKRDSVTLWFACKHPSTPRSAKAMGAFVVAYALSPIDLIPDFIPILGYLDEVILLPGLIWLTIRLLPRPILEECRAQANDWLEKEGKPRTKWGIVFVLSVWAIVAYGLGTWLRP